MSLHGALVAVVPATPERGERAVAPAEGRASAGFIAHLIATAARAPQTRARRRAEPEAGAAAYRTRFQAPTAPGSAVRRSL